MKELILGGVRSGKSRLAEQRAQESGLAVVYVATATPGDDEMRRRIEEHREQRHARWLTIEEPRALAQVVREHAGKDPAF
jgi:adenosylcobinamide kinase/adenosylcobinamide-phosphate guanylyltransferase